MARITEDGQVAPLIDARRALLGLRIGLVALTTAAWLFRRRMQ